MAVSIFGDNHATYYGSYYALLRLYHTLKEIRNASKVNKEIENIDFIVGLGDYIGGHVPGDEDKFTDPHDWVRVVNFFRVRKAVKVPELSQPSDECKAAILEEYGISDASKVDLERILDATYVQKQLELVTPIVEAARTQKVKLSYMEPESDNIPLVALLGNHEVTFVHYFLTGEFPPQRGTTKMGTVSRDIIKNEMEYAFAGYDKKLFWGLINDIAKKGPGKSQTIMEGELRTILSNHLKVDAAEIEQRADYQRLRETIPAVAYLYGLYLERIKVKNYNPRLFFEFGKYAKKSHEFLTDTISRLELMKSSVMKSSEGRSRVVFELQAISEAIKSAGSEEQKNEQYDKLEELTPSIIAELYEPQNEYLFVQGKHLGLLCSHSIPIGETVYVDLKKGENHKHPIDAIREFEFPQDKEVTAVAIGHCHTYYEFVVEVEDQVKGGEKDVLMLGAGTTGSQNESHDAEYTAISPVLYDRKIHNCSMLVEGPV